MASPGNHGAAARKDLRVLLPFSFDKLRIPDELAAEIGAGNGEALVIGPSSDEVKVWKVEVRRDGDGAVLGHGWPEFAAACGAGAGWFLVLRHRGRGVLTVKAFDASGSIREIGAPAPPGAEATVRSKATFKPQFIRVLPQDFIEKMLIPAKFVQHYILKEHLDKSKAVIFVPLGKIYQIELKMNQSGVFFAGGWPQFLSFHNITGPNTLLLRYEGNMVFTVKVFEANGCLRVANHKDIRMQQKSEQLQETPPSGQGEKRPNSSLTYLDHVKTECVYEIGPPAWVKKEVNTSTIGYCLALPAVFCNAVGLQESCLITLKTSLCGVRSWQLAITPRRRSSHRVTGGWKRFCQDNELKVGDLCTFNIVETRLWHVVIERC